MILAFGGSHALVCLCRRDKYCHKRGHRLRPPARRRLAWGSKNAIMAPSGGPLKTAGLQGKSRRVRGSVPFGGSNGLVCLSSRLKYWRNGAWPSPASTAVAGSGSKMGSWPPPAVPRKGLFAGERYRGPRFAPLGGSDALVRLPCR
jgi:hypothetical protein